MSETRLIEDVLADELAATKAALADLTAFTKQLSDALLTVRPLGGSELFTRHGGGDSEQYFADPEYLKNEIERDKEGYHAAICAKVRAEKSAATAEAALATERKRADEAAEFFLQTNEALQRLGEQYGCTAGSNRLDWLKEHLAKSAARVAKLEAALNEIKKACQGIAVSKSEIIEMVDSALVLEGAK